MSNRITITPTPETDAKKRRVNRRRPDADRTTFDEGGEHQLHGIFGRSDWGEDWRGPLVNPGRDI